MKKIMLIFLVSMFCSFLLIPTAFSVLPWYNLNWEYRMPITITEKSGSALSQYQTLVTIDTSSLITTGKMKADCGDIRFTDSEQQEIPYWLESGCNSANTKVWIKIPSIPASGNETIYLYYGNPSANSVSNKITVFEFFDDFSTNPNTNSKWTIYKYAGYADEGWWDSVNHFWYLTRAAGWLGVAALADYNLELTSWKADFDYRSGGGTGADGFVFLFYKNKTAFAAICEGSCLAFENKIGNMTGICLENYSNPIKGYGIEFDSYNNSCYDENGTLKQDPITEDHIAIIKDTWHNHLFYAQDNRTGDDTWHAAEVMYLNGNIKVKVDGGEVINAAIFPDYTCNAIGFSAGTGSLDDNHIISNFELRKYVEPEPTVTFGSEEPRCECSGTECNPLNNSEVCDGCNYMPTSCCGNESGEFYAGPSNGKSCDGTEACCGSLDGYSNNGYCVYYCEGGISEGKWFALGLGPAGLGQSKIQFEISDDNNPVSVVTDGEIPLNKFVHIAVTFNNTNKETQIFVNGELVKTGTLPRDITVSNNFAYSIGHKNFSFNGIVDEVKVYNRVISPDEIQKRYEYKKSIIYGDLPSQGGARTYSIGAKSANEVNIAPIIKIGNTEKICGIASKADLPKCEK